MENLDELMGRFPQPGVVTWIGLRPARRAALVACSKVKATPGEGLEGDRFMARSSTRREVTLIQGEHLDTVASLMHRDTLDPGLIRRNIVVRQINLLALKNRSFSIGGVVLEGTGLAHPCSRMEENLGPGGYNAMRGHGGITARIVSGGCIALDDPVIAL